MNKVVHFEIPFDNKDSCKEFYQKVFGWEFEDMPDMNYVIAFTRNGLKIPNTTTMNPPANGPIALKNPDHPQ